VRFQFVIDFLPTILREIKKCARTIWSEKTTNDNQIINEIVREVSTALISPSGSSVRRSKSTNYR